LEEQQPPIFILGSPPYLETNRARKLKLAHW